MYLSPEDFKTAEQNGIPYKIAYYRFYMAYWSKERTITEPINSKGHLKKLHQKALENGIDISYGTLASRINTLKWSEQKAISEPVERRKPREIS